MSASSWHWQQALRVLRREGVVACPTEAVWGLSCDPWSERATERLLALKDRPWEKGLILVAANEFQLEPFIEVPSKAAWKRAAVTWPGPATWVFPCTEDTPMWISGDQDTVAVRITAHPLMQELCLRHGGALVSTSANPAGRDPALYPGQVRMYFGEKLDFLLPGSLGGHPKPTSIRDATTGHILRR
ncbi:MAG TPA: Sua5/YciO/YrdC/YwlC family protein [Nevskiaceae bacterium]|nr:Sua5/YciO/YrdC/YwlC family protein [Nevskiaceae bacterium]